MNRDLQEEQESGTKIVAISPLQPNSRQLSWLFDPSIYCSPWLQVSAVEVVDFVEAGTILGLHSQDFTFATVFMELADFGSCAVSAWDLIQHMDQWSHDNVRKLVSQAHGDTRMWKSDLENSLGPCRLVKQFWLLAVLQGR